MFSMSGVKTVLQARNCGSRQSCTTIFQILRQYVLEEVAADWKTKWEKLQFFYFNFSVFWGVCKI